MNKLLPEAHQKRMQIGIIVIQAFYILNFRSYLSSINDKYFGVGKIVSCSKTCNSKSLDMDAIIDIFLCIVICLNIYKTEALSNQNNIEIALCS